MNDDLVAKKDEVIIEMFQEIKSSVDFNREYLLYGREYVEAYAQRMSSLTERVHDALGYTYEAHDESSCPLCTDQGEQKV